MVRKVKPRGIDSISDLSQSIYNESGTGVRAAIDLRLRADQLKTFGGQSLVGVGNISVSIEDLPLRSAQSNVFSGTFGLNALGMANGQSFRAYADKERGGVLTSGSTLVVGGSYVADTTAAPITNVSMPAYASVEVHQTILLINTRYGWATNPLTILAGTTNVFHGDPTDLVCDTNVDTLTLICAYKDGTKAHWNLQ